MKALWLVVVLAVGCAAPGVVSEQPTPQEEIATSATAGPDTAAPVAVLRERPDPALPPRIAMLAGLLPLKTIGADTFLVAHPEFDGRGVLIGILDSGIDPGMPGLSQTTTDRPKIIDLRDFSGEGHIELARLRDVGGDTAVVGGHRLTGFGRVARISSPPYYGGVFRELPLGSGPAADVNGNGRITDTFPVVVVKTSAGWIAITDTDSDGSLANESPVRDYGIGRETFRYTAVGATDGLAPMTFAVNIGETDGRPVVDFFFDNSSHGTRVAGIAAGHSLFGVDGFEGVAPGAQILGLKISNNARGSISVTGSMLKAMNYAANFAHQRGLPLVLNLSFGVGNEFEGTAAIDSIVNEFVLRHPDLLFVIAAGNDGPGISTIDFPGSADNALTVCALFPAVFASGANSENDRAEDGVAWWSARGGEVGKPDVCAPGVAYSNVPGWSVGDEISPGTSFAAPQIAGAAALLQSAMLQKGRRVRGIDVVRSLTNSAAPPSHSTRLDAGAGIPNVIGAYRWLLAAHQAGVYSVRALSDGGNSSHGSAAYRRGGLASPADTIQRFIVTSLGGQPAARLKLSSDAAWIATPAVVEPEGEPFTIALTYDATKLSEPGLYVGTVSARPASDTMAGASFTLTNTVVVPRELSRKFVHADSLNAGWVQRYFFTVPQDAGGLSVRFRGQGVAAGGTLYLFEPDGQPYRGRSSAEIDALDRSATIEVAAQDLRAGVYEAVVVAPPGGALEYSLEAAIPDVNVSAIDDGPVATVRNPGAQHVEVVVAAEAVGATRAMRLSGRRSDPAFERVTAPDWADRLVVDVTLDEEYWSRVTDFGVTVFDSTGAKLADGPLNYSFGRLTLPLDSLGYKGNMSIELIPAYAHLEPPAEWEADVRISFMPPAAIPFIFADSSREFAISLAPGSAEAVSATGSVGVVAIPDGFTPLVQVRAETPGGPVAIRRQAVGLTSDSTFTTRPREERTKR